MSVTDALAIIKLSMNAAKNATLGLFTITVGVAFIYVLTVSPEERVLDFISSFMFGTIAMLAAYVFLLLLYITAKNQLKTAEEKEKESNT